MILITGITVIFLILLITLRARITATNRNTLVNLIIQIGNNRKKSNYPNHTSKPNNHNKSGKPYKPNKPNNPNDPRTQNNRNKSYYPLP